MHYNKFVGPPCCRSETYAGRVACCPLVSHVVYTSCALLRLEKGQTNGRKDATPLHYDTARRCLAYA